MNKYILLLFSFSFYFLANAQLSCEQILDKKNDILIKSNKSTSDFIDDVDADITQLVHDFEATRVRLMMKRGDLKELNFWKAKADSIRETTALIIDELLEEMNRIAQIADSSDRDYVYRNSYTKKANYLKPLLEIKNLNNRTIPFKRIFGENMYDPNPEGIHIENTLLSFKNDVFQILGNYSFNGDTSSFIPFESEEFFAQSMRNIHPIDTSALSKINSIITLDTKTYVKDPQSDETVDITWMIDNFYYSSVLETAVIINQVILKIKLIEKYSLKLLSRKFNKGY
ncbi:hypothetical protein CW751_14420 [Brumimicrobium salinarum]|uniref:Gliding motility-associated protein GldM N-terminal domain-containing protein n=1 Tax=Brumimicrobium salinarum TaxID=2058658 RepID=A0A2I0QYY8_9FLAO|nr:hypothetical protein [Brumimicrobium salinarum]PKR79542.1 hypothetical protein CW751_14420 [Brumimicrobium salinarum]